MRVAIVNEGLAYPPTSGQWIRTLNLVLPLAERHEITYLCRASLDPREVAAADTFYRDNGIRPIIVPDPPRRKRGVAFYGRLLANLTSRVPYAVAGHDSSMVRREIARLEAEQEVDLWQFETPAYVDAPRSPTPRLFMAHNVESMIWQRMAESEANPLKRWYIRQQYRKFRRFEGEVTRRATTVVTVSDVDRERFMDLYGLRRVAVVDNGVDVERIASVTRDRRLNRILFLGNLEWRPNLDALDILLDEVFPRVVRSVPDARLVIVGRNPSRLLVERVGAIPNTEVHGNVPDVRPYLAESTVMAVPLRVGSGTRLKILEAAAAGLPVVSTSVGAEGLRLVPDRDILIRDRPEEMAAGLVSLIDDQNRARAIGAAAREVVRAEYDWRTLSARLETIWEQTRSQFG